MDQDPCVRQAGESLVHFSAYQPQYELKDQYCTEIPQEGHTFLVVDLVDPDGTVVARGVVGFDATELPDLIGRSSHELSSAQRRRSSATRARSRSPATGAASTISVRA